MQEALQYAVLHEFVAPARRNISRGTWDYLMGGSETETTYVRNRIAIDSLAFRPRVLRNVEKVDARAIVTGGHRYAYDMTRPGMLYGRIVRPPAFHSKLASIDTKAASAAR